GIFGITEDLIKMTLYRQPLLKFKIMKKCLLILTTVLCFNSTYSQILYSENFDNLSIGNRSEEHTSELQSRENLVCRLLIEKKHRHSPRALARRASSCSMTPGRARWARTRCIAQP